MIVRVRLFAAYREAADSPELELELPVGATVADARRALADRYPRLAAILPAGRPAIDREFVAPHAPIPPGAEVAFLPPVSGGRDG